MDGADWTVVNAEPTTSAEFVQSGQLNLTLRKVERMAVDDILYTLPTVANDIGAIEGGSSKAGKNVLSFHEDDWRQFEFVSDRFAPEIERELAAILQIWEEQSVANDGLHFFKKVHVRQQIPAPIASPFTLDRLLQIFPTMPVRYDGLSFDQSDGLVKNGFAFRLDGALEFYGLAPGGVVTVLGIALGNGGEPPSPETVEAIAKFMDDNKLTLLNWPNMEQNGSDPTLLAGYLAEFL